MKTISVRALSREAGNITEPVLVLHDRRIIGTYTPLTVLGEVTGVLDLGKNMTEATVDEVKKAIEPDKVRESRGRLTKGLGEVPGVTPSSEVLGYKGPTFTEFRPAPKPGKK